MSRNLCIGLAAFILLWLNGPPAITAATPGAPAELAEKIKSQQQKIKRVRDEIADHQELVRQTRTTETNLFEQLEIIDQALRDGMVRMAELQAQTARQEELIREKAEELGRKNIEKDLVKEHVKKRLAAFYRMGDIGFMNVTFSATTLPDLLNFTEYFKTLIKYDQQVINDYRLKIDNLIEIKNLLETEKDELLRVIVAGNDQKKHLETVRQERVALLAKVNTEKKLYRRAIEEMEAASANLTATLANLREKLVAGQQSPKHFYSSPKKRRPGASRGFPAMKGKLVPPVRGSVTTNFGKNTQGKFGITTFADGIDIKTVAGSEITAVYGGKVVYAGQLKGYGNLIIIDHDYQYYSLISRAAELYKKEGDTVSTGEAIGIMNESGGLLGEGLHFEIRHGTEPENPLLWLAKNLLTVGSPRAAVEPAGKTTRNN
jgi:septal ring factor EnvC (AmiA/AmiB activator)